MGAAWFSSERLSADDDYDDYRSLSRQEVSVYHGPIANSHAVRVIWITNTDNRRGKHALRDLAVLSLIPGRDI